MQTMFTQQQALTNKIHCYLPDAAYSQSCFLLSTALFGNIIVIVCVFKICINESHSGSENCVWIVPRRPSAKLTGSAGPLFEKHSLFHCSLAYFYIINVPPTHIIFLRSNKGGKVSISQQYVFTAKTYFGIIQIHSY